MNEIKRTKCGIYEPKWVEHKTKRSFTYTQQSCRLKIAMKDETLDQNKNDMAPNAHTHTHTQCSIHLQSLVSVQYDGEQYGLSISHSYVNSITHPQCDVNDKILRAAVAFHIHISIHLKWSLCLNQCATHTHINSFPKCVKFQWPVFINTAICYAHSVVADSIRIGILFWHLFRFVFISFWHCVRLLYCF